MSAGTDTIAAISTAPGRGAIGVIRFSGDRVPDIAGRLFGRLPEPRHATLCTLSGVDGEAVDSGLVLFFPGPASYTGEHMLEFHGHGGPVVMDAVLRRALDAGARLAEPGEFSKRAFLNGKLDLAQAEAVADLIDSATEAAARAAVRSLHGEFSLQVSELVEALIELRTFIEAGIDFPDDEIDVLADPEVAGRLAKLASGIADTLSKAREGAVLTGGIRLLLAGRPNAGKSSLMNALLNEERAIVTATPGTTRDVVDARHDLGGLPVTLVDTAGIRSAADEIEVEGVDRAVREQDRADLILEVVDDSEPHLEYLEFRGQVPLIRVLNKIDLSGRRPGRVADAGSPMVAVSALRGSGLDELRSEIRRAAGLGMPEDSLFSARGRHLAALREAATHIDSARAQISPAAALELVAEELRLAQRALAAITGEFSSDDLLGRIFSSFCLGK